MSALKEAGARFRAGGATEQASVEDFVAPMMAGDALARRELLKRLAPVVHARVQRVLRRRVGGGGSRWDAADLVHEVFLLLLDGEARVLRSWDGSRGLGLEAFVGLVAERETLSFLRSGRRSAWAEAPTQDLWISEAVEGGGVSQLRTVAARQLLGRLLDRLQEKLSPRGYALFEALFVDERDLSEVAQDFGMTHAALYSFRSRARSAAVAIAAELGADLSEDPSRAASGAQGDSRERTS